MIKEGMKIKIFPETDIKAYTHWIRSEGFKAEIGPNYIYIGKQNKERKTIDKRELGKRIRQERRRLGLSRIDLADKIGMAQSTLYNWEIGRTAPRKYAIEELKKMGFEMGDLL